MLSPQPSRSGALHLANITVLGALMLLSACSEPRPDGHVYQMNGAGMTLPAAGAEIAFLPGKSRAEFFYLPLREAYVYATADLGTELIPTCNQTQAVLAEIQEWNDSALLELTDSGNLPATPEACFNMCTQRVNLEEQRGRDREQLGETISRLDSAIANAQEKIKTLQASRSEKAGELGRRLASLEKARDKELLERANELVKAQIAKLEFELRGELGTSSLYAGQQIRVTLTNGSKYALKAAEYRNNPLAEGYYRGTKVSESEIRIPRYGTASTLTDEFGFDKGYLVPPGGSVVIGGGGINDFPGLPLSTPEGKLLARERGWTPNRQGYVLPDEIRIKEFSPDLFVIPDKNGTRNGSAITYSPKQVDFRTEAAAQGLPQDAQIARLKRQIANQSYPEDLQINEQRSLIASIKKEHEQTIVDFNNSALATQIGQLAANESDCRAARDVFAEVESQRQKLAKIQTNLSTCGSENLDPTAILTGVTELNRVYGTRIETPDVSSRYRVKASTLVMAKLSESISKSTLTGIDGDYSIIDGIDPAASLVLVNWRSGFDESFWFQPLATLGDRKDLTHIIAENGSFEDFVGEVISYGMGVDSLDELSARLIAARHDATSPFSMKSKFETLADTAADAMLAFEDGPANEIAEDMGFANDAPLSCQP